MSGDDAENSQRAASSILTRGTHGRRFNHEREWKGTTAITTRRVCDDGNKKINRYTMMVETKSGMQSAVNQYHFTLDSTRGHLQEDNIVII
jgi:hypothetical protein